MKATKNQIPTFSSSTQMQPDKTWVVFKVYFLGFALQQEG